MGGPVIDRARFSAFVGSVHERRAAALPEPVPVTPERSLAQRMEALERANEIRTRRADIKRGLKAGRLRIDVLLLEADSPDYAEWLDTMKVIDLLLAAPKYGRVKANKALVRARISPSKSIGGMTVRQRTELVSMLRGR